MPTTELLKVHQFKYFFCYDITGHKNSDSHNLIKLPHLPNKPSRIRKLKRRNYGPKSLLGSGDFGNRASLHLSLEMLVCFLLNQNWSCWPVMLFYFPHRNKICYECMCQICHRKKVSRGWVGSCLCGLFSSWLKTWTWNDNYCKKWLGANLAVLLTI